MTEIEPKEIAYILLGILPILIAFKEWQDRHKESNFDNSKHTELSQSTETKKPDLITRLAKTDTKLTKWLQALLGFVIIGIVFIDAIYDPLVRQILFITIGVLVILFCAYTLSNKKKI